MAYSLLLLRANCEGGKPVVATVDFSDWTIPETVYVGEEIDIFIKYKIHTIVPNDDGGWLNNFPGYDGMCHRYLNPTHTNMEYWVWRVLGMDLLFREPGTSFTEVEHHPSVKAGNEFTYHFHGTIEELLGRPILESCVLNLEWSIGVSAYGWTDNEWWPWDFNPPTNFMDNCYGCYLEHQITVSTEPPPPPSLEFNTDLCSVSKTSVSPSENFTVQLSIYNDSETATHYYLGYFCEGGYYDLTNGDIGSNVNKQYNFTTTANEIAHRVITQTQYLAITFVVLAEEEESDRWMPPAIAVIVDGNGDLANLSGTVTDEDGLPIDGATVTAGGKSDATNVAGLYSISNISTGSTEIVFKKSGFKTETRTRVLFEGDNTLDIVMIEGEEGLPGWVLPVSIGAIAVGVALMVKKK